MTKTIRILVVEDEPKVGNFIKEGLEEHSYFVDLVTDGRLGMIMFKDNSYDLIVLDVLMPEFSGLELCKLIREVNHQVPILMLTALGTMEDKLSGFESGADDYLIKPFEFKELLARIRALTRRNYRNYSGGCQLN